ncbi:MAG: polysaccharide biosynthesis tyrosine autokinase [Pirellulaceae bacterium]
MPSEPAAPPIDAAPFNPAPFVEQADSSWNVLAFAWRRKWIVFLFLVSGLGLGYLYFLRQPPVFSTSAQILLVEATDLPINGPQFYPGYNATHETLIVSPIVVSRAVEQYDLGSLVSLRNTADPVSKIIGQLEASRVGDRRTYLDRSDIVAITFRCSERDDCQIIVEAIISSYQDFLGDTYQDVGTETAELITRAKDQLDQQISETEAEYRQFRLDSPLIFSDSSTQSVHDKRSLQIEQVRSAAILEASRIRAEIETLEKAIEEGGSRTALNLLVRHMSDADVAPGASVEPSVEDQIQSALLEERMLLEKYGPDHPEVIATRRRIELTRELAAAPPASTDLPGPESEDFLVTFLQSLRQRVKMQDQVIQGFDELFEEEREKAKSLSSYQAADGTFRSELDRKRRLFDVVIGRLEEINLIKQGRSPQVELIGPPTAVAQIEPDIQRTMLVSGLLALLAGLGIAFVIDSADRRFRSPDEICNDLGLPVVGHIPIVAKAGRGNGAANGRNGRHALSPMLHTLHSPRGSVAEAHRAVRTSLYFSMRGGGPMITQVTSPNPGDGKTTISGNLAIATAQSGKQVLLVDADFRRPCVHSLFEMDNDVGTSSLIAGTAELADALQDGPVENLSILTCGPRPQDPSALLLSSQFARLLEVLRGKFEVIIIDTPPVLAVTDPLNVAQHVDGTFVVVRLNKNARNTSRRALDELKGVGANLLGVVVNGAGGRTRYGGYRPRYSAGYGYSYGYGSTRSYYDEHHRSKEAPGKNGNGASASDVPASTPPRKP